MTKTAAKPTAAALATFKPKNELANIPADNRGAERVTNEDLILPKILLMQGLSKMVQEKGKVAGQFVNSLTEATLENTEFVPVVYTKFFNVVEWQMVGGKMKQNFLFRTFDPSDDRLVGKRLFNSAEGKAEVETVMNFLSLINGQPCIIPFSKTSTRAGQKLLTFQKLSKQALFANKYKLVAVKQTNDQGTFYVKDVQLVGPIAGDELAEAEAAYSSFAPKAEVVQAAAEVEEVPF